MLPPHSSASQSLLSLVVAATITLLSPFYSCSAFVLLPFHGAPWWQDDSPQSAEGRLLYEAGVRFYKSHSAEDLRRAQATFETARQVCATALDRLCEENSLTLLGLVSQDLGRYEQAELYARQAFLIASTSGDKHRLARTLTNLSIILTKNGKLGEAASTAQRSLEIGQTLNDRPNMAKDLLNLGIVQMALGQHLLAQKSLESALAIARELGDKRSEASVLGELAITQRMTGHDREALQYIEQSLKLDIELHSFHELAIDYLSRSHINLNLGNFQAAWDDLEHAAEIFRGLQEPAGEAGALHGLGVMAELIGSYRQALNYYQRSLVLFGEGQPEHLWRAHRGIGACLWKLKKPEEAKQEYTLAIAAVENLRAGVREDTDKISFFDTVQVVYRQFVEFLLEQGQNVEALEVAEAGRARAFVDLLRSRNISVGLKASTLKATEMKQIAASLNSSILEYFATGNGLAIWLVRADGQVFSSFVAFQRQRGAEPDQLSILVKIIRENIGVEDWRVSRLRGARSKRRDGTTEPDKQLPPANELSVVSRRMYHTLIPPEIERQLPKELSASLIIVPHEELFLVPFAMLENEQGELLIDRFMLSESPSIAVLAETHKRHLTRNFAGKAAPAEVLIMGNPQMPEVDGVKLQSLDYLAPEVNDIARQFGSHALMNDKASESAFKRAASSKRIIHLATHGEANDASPMNSYLALAPSAGEDGLLTAAEVAELRLQADLVVLSACQTGLGLISGDGIVGLSRSFLLSGADSVVVSLWRVDDLSTASLMKEFYTQLLGGKTKKAALRDAMRSLRKRSDLPYQWAPFVLIGEPQ